MRRLHNTYPLPAYVTRWADLPTNDEALFHGGWPVSEHFMRRPRQLSPLSPRHCSSPLPRVIGDVLSPRPQATVADGLGYVVMGLRASDRQLLELVGKHPFLTPERLATVLGWSVPAVRQHRNRLIEQGLMRLVGADEIGPDSRLHLAELTIEGMEILAAGQGLTFTHAVLWHGLTGGGSRETVGPRRKLLANLAHTLGTDALFVDLYRVARHMVENGADDGVLEWQNSTACSRRHFRPDGYGVYEHDGWVYDFYLEYDRATMGPKGLAHKFCAYYDYWNRQRFRHSEYRFPRVLFVTVNNAAEERIARAVCRAAMGQHAILPVLLTCEWRINDPCNPLGLLGPIWREAVDEFEHRRSWIPVSSSTPDES